MIDYRNIIKNREFRLKLIQKLSFIPDAPYLKMVFWIKSGKRLNLKNPKTFCDKQNWLKIHNKHPEYTQMADKLAVRDIVNKKLGGDYFFPLLGVWDSYDDIDFDKLPDQFVLKCNHDSGSVKLITDKSKINHKEFKRFFNGRMKMKPHTIGREYPYKDIKPKIFAEQFMTVEGSSDLSDYKFICFNGKIEFMYITSDRNTNFCFDFFDNDFNHLDINHLHPQSGKQIKKPETFEEMKKIASKLSENLPFVRIDLYEIQGKVYFSEYTFFHAGGFWPFPPEWEEKLGSKISLDPVPEYK